MKSNAKIQAINNIKQLHILSNYQGVTGLPEHRRSLIHNTTDS